MNALPGPSRTNPLIRLAQRAGWLAGQYAARNTAAAGSRRRATGGARPGLGLLLNAQPEAGHQFRLGQNHPNPFRDRTTVPFTLAGPADVTLVLFDLAGRRVLEIIKPGLDAGLQEIILSLPVLDLAHGSYVYELHVHNANGRFAQRKLMTAAQ